MENGCVRARITEIASGWSATLAPQLAGRFQLQNAINAVAAARSLSARGYRVPESAIEQGIAGAIWPGRLEKLQSHPDVYVDGAHNPGAARGLAAFWEEDFASGKIFLLYGALRDKAVDEIAGVLFPYAAEVVFTEPRTPRAISASQLSELAAHHAAHSSVIPDAEQALDYLLSRAAPQDAVFVTGSLYLVGQLRHYWKQRAQVAAG
jgi:dihydrofolate synthase/folylpolyglutamate synthase